MRALAVFLVFLSFECFGQELPYELERLGRSYYESKLESLDSDFTNSEEALQFYLLSYKSQRAVAPSDYFLAPNARRIDAKAFLESLNDGSEALAIIKFLESNGSQEAVESLNGLEIESDEALPYLFIVAYILNDTKRKHEVLNKMRARNILSDVLIAFGENMVLSSENLDEILTNGLQDLIAVEYALMKGDANKRVYNVFASKCLAYSGPSIQEVLSETPYLLISPAMSKDFYSTYGVLMSLKGIGLFNGNLDLENSLLNKLNAVSKHFSGIGLKPETPADQGLIKSYCRFYEAITAADAMKLLKGNDNLLKYLKKYC